MAPLSLKVGGDNPHILVTSGFPVEVLKDLMPNWARKDYKIPQATTFGFKKDGGSVSHNSFDFLLVEGRHYPLDQCFVETSWFDAVFANVADLTDTLYFHCAWTGIMDLAYWGAVVGMIVSPAQFADLVGSFALRFENPMAIKLPGGGIFVVGRKKMARKLDRAAQDEMTEAIMGNNWAGGTFEYLPREIVIEGTHRGDLPRKWRTSIISAAELSLSQNDNNPLGVFSDDLQADSILAQPPLTPSLAGIAKYIASGKCGDVTVGPLGEIVYLDGFSKKVKATSKVMVDGEEITVESSSPRTEAWGIILESAPQSNLAAGDYIWTRY